jgi:hypothetical protein
LACDGRTRSTGNNPLADGFRPAALNPHGGTPSGSGVLRAMHEKGKKRAKRIFDLLSAKKAFSQTIDL